MPSASAKRKADKKRLKDKQRVAPKGKLVDEEIVAENGDDVTKITEDIKTLNARATSGVLSSHQLSADVHIHNFSLTFHGKVRRISSGKFDII